MIFSKMKLENNIVKDEDSKVFFQNILFEKNEDSIKSIDNTSRDIIDEDDDA